MKNQTKHDLNKIYLEKDLLVKNIDEMCVIKDKIGLEEIRKIAIAHVNSIYQFNAQRFEEDTDA